MRKLITLAFALLALPAFGQYGRMDFSLQNAQGQAIAGATVNVYTQAACGTPTTGTLATLYPAANGGTPIVQPLITDGFGHAFAYASAACYTYVYNSPYTGQLTYIDQVISTPSSGSGNVISSPQLSIFYQPNSGSSATAQGDQKINTDGNGHLSAVSIGGIPYAKQFQTTPSSNNGIANCVAAGSFPCTADPSYSSTEKPTPASFGAGTYHYADWRINQIVDFYHNPQYLIHSVFGDNAAAGHIQTCLFDKIDTATFGDIVNAGCFSMNHTSAKPGWDIGNPITSGIDGSAAGWLWSVPFRINHTINSAGIAEGQNITQFKFGVGDNISAYFFVTGHGGYVDASGEGIKAFATNTNEDQHTYAGTLSSGGGTGSTLLHTAGVQDIGFQGVGQYVIDTTKTPITGTFTNIAAGLVGSAVTVDTSVAVSNAWGTLAADVGTPLNTVSPFSTSETFNVTITSGTFDTSHLACMGGQYHDCAFPTAVGSVGGGVQSVTIPLRRAHASGTYIFQGGLAGYGLEATSFTVQPQGQPLRYLFDVLGSTDAHTLQAVLWQTGSAKPVTIPITSYQSFNINTGLTNSGTTVSGVYSGTGALLKPPAYNGATFTFSGSSDAALNGNPCANITWTSSSAFSCTMAGLTGSHTSSTTSTASLAQNGFNLRPMAETLDVQNETLTPPQIDGTLQLEPNVMVTSNGDTIEQTHHVSSLYQSMTESMITYTPFNGPGGYSNHLIATSGTGAQGGSGSTTSASLLKLYNTQPDSSYIGSGGSYVPENMMNWSGPYLYGILADRGPAFAANSAFIRLGHSSTQNNDANYSYNVLEVDNLASSFLIQNFAKTGNEVIATSGTANLTIGAGGTFTLQTPVLTGAPTAPTPSPGDNTTKIATTAFVEAALPSATLAPFTAVTITSHAGTLATAGGAFTNGTVALDHTLTTTINVSGLVNGANFNLRLTQDSSGANTLTMGTGCTWLVGSGSGFVASTTPTLTAGASGINVLSAIFDGSNCLYNIR